MLELIGLEATGPSTVDYPLTNFTLSVRNHLNLASLNITWMLIVKDKKSL